MRITKARPYRASACRIRAVQGAAASNKQDTHFTERVIQGYLASGERYFAPILPVHIRLVLQIGGSPFWARL